MNEFFRLSYTRLAPEQFDWLLRRLHNFPVTLSRTQYVIRQSADSRRITYAGVTFVLEPRQQQDGSAVAEYDVTSVRAHVGI